MFLADIKAIEIESGQSVKKLEAETEQLRHQLSETLKDVKLILEQQSKTHAQEIDNSTACIVRIF